MDQGNMPNPLMDEYMGRLLRGVVDKMLEGFQIISRDWRYLYVNDTVVAQGKSSRDKLLGRTMMECYPGIETTPFFAQLRRAMQERVTVQMLNEFIFPDGSRGTFQLSMHPVEEGVLILSNDITAKERVLMESIGDGVFAVDRDWKVLLWNRAAEDLTGWRADEAVGKPLRDLIRFVRAKDRAENMAFIDDAMNMGKSRSMENDTLMLGRDGREIPVGDSAAPIHDPHTGAVSGVIVVFRSVAAEYELRRKEREVALFKRDFLFKTIHDLRSPASTLRLMLLDYGEARTCSPEKMLQDLTSMKRVNERMMRLIEDLVEIASGEGSEKPLKKDRLSLPSVLHGCLDELLPAARAKNVTVTYAPPSDIPAIAGDEDALREVFGNLLDNAVKYSHDGGSVEVTHQVGADFLRTTVRDHGIGIAADVLPTLFRPYVRGVTDRDIQGTGLGLYIVKNLAEKMGGSVVAESVPGEGASFTVTLPLAA